MMQSGSSYTCFSNAKAGTINKGRWLRLWIEPKDVEDICTEASSAVLFNVQTLFTGTNCNFGSVDGVKKAMEIANSKVQS